MYTTITALLSSSRVQSIGVVLALSAGLLSLFSDLSAASWRADDTQILTHTLSYPVLQNFYNAEVWQRFSPSNLTPWIVVSFKIDYLIFGIAPSGFYLHQLFSILAVAFICYVLLSLWIEKRFAFAAALVFLVGLPVTDAANNLMTRHYVEGLVFAGVAVYFCVRYLRERKRIFAISAVFFYILSMMAKEIYVPLVLLIPLFSDGSFRSRLYLVVSFAAAALLYTFWRGYMLSSFVGGYTAASQLLAPDYWLTVFGFVTNIPSLLLGRFWLPIFFAYSLMLLFLLARNWRALIIFGGVVLVELLPLVPLASVPSINYPGRYYFLLWFSFCFSFGFLCHAFLKTLTRSLKSGVSSGILVLVFVLLASPLIQARALFESSIAPSNSQFDVQAQFMWEHGSDAHFLPSQRLLETFWFVRGMRQLKLIETPTATSPTVVLDPFFLSQTAQPLFEYDSDCRCMVDVSHTLAQRLTAHQNSLNDDGPLAVEISFQNNLFKWNFGPYEDSHYYIFSDYLGVINFPSSGEFFFNDIQGPLEVRVGHFPPGGLKTYSAPLLIAQDVAPVRWSK